MNAMLSACTYEDRPSHAVGLKLLVLSLGVHCPGLTIDVFLGPQMQALRPWLAKHSHVRVFDWPTTSQTFGHLVSTAFAGDGKTSEGTKPPMASAGLRRNQVGTSEGAVGPSGGGGRGGVDQVAEKSGSGGVGGEVGGKVGGWSVKPWIMLYCLASSAANAYSSDGSIFSSFNPEKTVLWLDADLILTADVRPLLPSDSGIFLAAQEPLYSLPHGSDRRTLALGMQVGRVLSRTLNSCCLRAGPAHLSLLKAWAQATERSDYLHWQTIAESQRPLAFLGDQELLNGLLGSTDFSHIPLACLETGTHIAHCVGARGYRPSERLRNLGRGLPPLVHAMGPKPWLPDRNLFAQWSAYCWAARPYQDQLDEVAPWIYPDQLPAKIIRWLMLDQPNLVGLPMSILGALRARHQQHA